VVLADVEESKLAEATEALVKTGAAAIGVRTDVAKAAEVDALARRAVEAFGAVHVLCNNAGVGSGGLAWEVPAADWEWTLGVNLCGVIHGIRAFVPAMIAQGEGHVVNTASIAGVLSVAGLAPYCVSKHGVVTLSECLHHDLTVAAKGAVKVTVVCPGWVRTGIAEATRNRPEGEHRAPPSPHDEAMAKALREAVAGGIPPEDVAEAVHDAVVNERFYVFTHPKLKGAFKRRAEEILEERTPTFDPNLG